jgi:hypothetical protein
MHVFEDLLAAYGIAALSGSYPSTDGGCTTVCVALLMVALMHPSYVLIVRPYREGLEQLLALINAVFLVSVSVCAVWSRVSGTDSDNYGTAAVAMGYCLLTANAYYFVQLIVLTVSATLHECRRVDRRAIASAEPLLIPPLGSHVDGTPARHEDATIAINPLDQPDQDHGLI